MYILVFNDYCLEYIKCILTGLGFSKTTPHIQCSQGGHIGLSIQLYLRLLSTTMKGSKAKLAKGIGVWGEVQA